MGANEGSKEADRKMKVKGYRYKLIATSPYRGKMIEPLYAKTLAQVGRLMRDWGITFRVEDL